MKWLVFRLSEKRLDKLSDIISDVGLVALAVVVIPAVIDKFDLFKVVLGLIVTVFLWSFSIWLRK